MELRLMTRHHHQHSIAHLPMSFVLASDLTTRRIQWWATKTDGSQHATPLTPIEIAAWGRTNP